MFKVPAPIERLFETFPVVTYPKENITEEVYQFYFEGRDNGKESFQLGVHKVYELNSRYIPTDPISLGYALWLCHKNQLKLPNLRSNTKKSNNSIIQLSYHATPDQQLPILIENSGENRNIIPLDSLNKSENFETKLINDLIDSKFVDLWLLCLLIEKPTEVFQQQEDLLNLNNYHTFSEIPHWKAFSIRYPNLFENFININTFYKSELRLFKDNLQLLSSNFVNLDRQTQLKLAGFIIVFDSLLSGTKVGAVVKEFPELIKLNYKLFDEF